jgi:hypothetical protein
MMMSIEDHLKYGTGRSFAERVIYDPPSDKAYKFVLPAVGILIGLIAVGVVKVFTSVFVVG